MVNKLTHAGDQQLLHDLRERGGEKDRIAFAALYRRNLPMLLGALARMDRSTSLQDREDFAQQVFVDLWRTRGAFRGECSIAHYLIRIAANLISKHHRSEMRRKRREASIIAVPADQADESIQSRETAELVRQALGQLPEVQRQAVSLVLLQGRCVAEAAQIVRCSAETMKSRYRRGKRLLKQQLRDLA